MNKVTVIIPVYNALEFTKICIESIYDSKNQSDFDLLVINDKSPQEGIKSYLDSLKHNNLTVIHNDENLGFVGTCNKAMKLSNSSDVILLNSDTEVTSNWIDKLKKAAYSKNNIATVTPLSNNASIASVPVAFQDNEIPNRYDKDTFNILIEKLSQKIYPQVPTGVGYCMYIKRTALEEVGYFDIETFKKGYGEENDFCQRAIKMGWINIIDDQTFIYHKGHASFTPKKAEPIENMQKLQKKYPNFLQDVAKYAENNPLSKFNELVDLTTQFGVGLKSKKVILNIHHTDLSAGGGTKKHVHNLTSNLTNYNFITVFPLLEKGMFVEFKVGGEIIATKLLFLDSQKQNNIKLLIESLISVFDIQTIHLHHALNWDKSILETIANQKVNKIITFHDLFLINYSTDFFTSNDKKLLHVQDQNYKKYLESNINKFNQLIFPSDYLKNHFNQEFSFSTSQHVFEHGTNLPKRKKKSIYKHSKLRLGFVGIPAQSKGIETFFRLIEQEKSRFSFYVIGTKEHGFYELLNKFNIKENLDFKVIPYKDGNPQGAILNNEIDIVIFPSSVPESFSYTLSEVIQSSTPVIGNNVGAIAQRIGSMNLGWTYKNFEELKQILTLLDEHREELRAKQVELDNIEALSLSTMLEFYNRLYSQVNKGQYTNEIKSEQLKLLISMENLSIEEIAQIDRVMKERKQQLFKRKVIQLPVLGKIIYKSYLWVKKYL